jgi:hypothetical protein
MYGHDEGRTTLAIELIADMVLDALRADENNHHYALTSEGPVHLGSEGALRQWLRKSVDPNDHDRGDVRTLNNCRCVTFGYDGQAFLCLRHNDDEPISPDTSLAVVEDVSHILIDTDFLDGWIAIGA